MSTFLVTRFPIFQLPLCVIFRESHYPFGLILRPRNPKNVSTNFARIHSLPDSFFLLNDDGNFFAQRMTFLSPSIWYPFHYICPCKSTFFASFSPFSQLVVCFLPILISNKNNVFPTSKNGSRWAEKFPKMNHAPILCFSISKRRLHFFKNAKIEFILREFILFIHNPAKPSF